jgi:hypothetical protein
MIVRQLPSRCRKSLVDAPTILQLFNGTQAAPAGMTEWDRAFLKSLYTTPPAQANAAAMAYRAGHGKGYRALICALYCAALSRRYRVR